MTADELAGTMLCPSALTTPEERTIIASVPAQPLAKTPTEKSRQPATITALRRKTSATTLAQGAQRP